MTYEEFRRHIGKAGLTVHGFADLLRMNRISLSNYKNGEVPSHLAVIAALMGAMADGQTDFRSVLAHVEIVHKRPRGARTAAFGGHKQNSLFPSQVAGNKITGTTNGKETPPV